MINIILEMHWSNNPIPLNELLKKPEIIFDIPLGLFTSLESPVTSVQGKTGAVELNAEDVEADPIGSAQAVQSFIGSIIQPQIESLSENKLDRVDYVQHHLGTFISKASLDAAHPVANEGDSADIDSGTGFDVMRAIWDANDQKWVIREVGNASNSDQVPEGNTNLYFKAERVRETTIGTLTPVTPSEILPTDDLTEVFEKLIAQIKDLKTVWVTAQSIGVLSQFVHTNSVIEFAKINGLLWIRGFLQVTQQISQGQTIFDLTDLSYELKVKTALNTDYPQIHAIASLFLRRDEHALVYQTNPITFHQSLIAGSAISTNDFRYYHHIQATCLGELINM